MSGFCGFAGPVGTADESADVLGRMARRLTRFDGSRAETLASGAAAVAAASPDARPSVAGDGDRLAAVAGRPEFDDPDLAALAAERGAAGALLEAWRRGGPELARGVRGTFALALVHAGGREALLVGDRIAGRIPVAWSAGPRGLVFATAADALEEHPGSRAELDPQALYDYLYFHVVPAPRSARLGVARLLPGTLLRYRDGHASVERYADPPEPATDAPALAGLEREFRERLREAVRRAHEPGRTGCFLSGGTDSSTVAGLLTEIAGEPVPTFSIGFDAPGYDEVSYARIAARRFGTDHHEYYLRPDDVAALIPRVAEVHPEPFGNESVVPAFHCARMARELGIELLLGGDGGDELFAGNTRYAKQRVFEPWTRIPRPLRRGLIEPLLLGAPGGDRVPLVRKARSYVRQAAIPMPDRTQGWTYLERLGAEVMLEPEFLARIDRDEPRRLLREAWSRPASGGMLHRYLAMDMQVTLADNDLPKVARMCELAGTRVGFPFLDDDVVAFAARVPERYKMRGTQLRWFFKRALRDFLPPEILTKPKHGMGTPFGIWLATHDGLGELVRDSLAGLGRRGIVRPAFLERLLGLHRDEHAVYWGVLIWVLVQLEQWLRLHATTRTAAAAR